MFFFRIFISANGAKLIGGDYEIGRSVRVCVYVCVSVCLSVCLCSRIGEDMHSDKRLLVQ